MKKAKWIYQYTKGSRSLLVLFSAVVTVAAICSLLIAYILKKFIDVATEGKMKSLGDVVLLAGIVLLVGGVMHIVGAALKNRIECNVEWKVRNLILESIFEGDYLEIQKIHTGDVLTKLTEDVTSVAQFFPCIINDVVGSLAIALMAIAYLFILNAKLTLIIFVTIPILVAVISMFNFPMAKGDKKKKDAEESNRILMQEQLNNVKTVKIYGIQRSCLQLLNKSYKEFSKKKIILAYGKELHFS